MATKRFFSRDDVLAAVLIDENSDSEDSDDEDKEGIGAYIGPELPDSELVDDYDDVETCTWRHKRCCKLTSRSTRCCKLTSRCCKLT